MHRTFRYTLLLVLFFAINISAQTFGFGCLGLSSFYAGFSEYRFKAPALDNYSNPIVIIGDQSFQSDLKFGKATGYRVGANLFRAKWDRFFITAKGFYQFLKEEKSNLINSSVGALQFDYKLEMNHWGVGIDLGTTLFWILDWKIIEGEVTFYDVAFTEQNYNGSKLLSETKYSTDQMKTGYFLGTGLILHIVPDYISVEGTIGYNVLEIDKISADNNKTIPTTGSNLQLIEKGIWSGSLQLNVGFPF